MRQKRRPTKADLVAIARWAKVFEAPSFSPGTWVVNTPGVMPYFAASEPVLQFVHEVYERKLLLAFDWTSWGKEAHRLMESPKAIAAADLTTCRRLVFGILRSDRFVEGMLAAAISDGTMTRVLRRIRTLASAPSRKRQ